MAHAGDTSSTSVASYSSLTTSFSLHGMIGTVSGTQLKTCCEWYQKKYGTDITEFAEVLHTQGASPEQSCPHRMPLNSTPAFPCFVLVSRPAWCNLHISQTEAKEALETDS